MLYRYSEVFLGLLMIADLALVGSAWLGAHWLRFETGLPAPAGVPPLSDYANVLLVILPTWWLVMNHYGVYEPKRLSSPLRETGELLRVSAAAVFVLVGISFFVRSHSYSRGVVLIFSALAPSLLIGQRLLVRGALRAARRRGFNLRYALVVGAGRLAEEIIERIHDHPQAGMRVEGVLADGAVGRDVAGVPVIGDYSQLKQALEPKRIDQVIVALPRSEWMLLDKVLADLEDEVTSVKFAPDLLHIMTLHSSVESLDGLPIVSLRDTPLVGWASVRKRAFDIVGSALLLALLCPLLLAIGVAIGATTGRPIIYGQRRMGLDGRVFTMFKFRSMKRDAEADAGPVWATPDDPRRTGLGAILRRLSLDELPQLWNVLKGDMSLVGPRPERPIFIEEFRREIPGYMLRHKVKAGLTGWAQVHGWRGNTSLHERIEHDIYYIQNWSLGLDIQILLMTFWRGLFDRNAY